jgi:hypothetical protein
MSFVKEVPSQPPVILSLSKDDQSNRKRTWA